VVSAVKLGAVSLIRGTVEVAGVTVAVLMFALLEKIDDPAIDDSANCRIHGLVLPQLSIAGECSTSKKETHLIWAGWVSKTLLRYPHPGVRVQQHRTGRKVYAHA